MPERGDVFMKHWSDAYTTVEPQLQQVFRWEYFARNYALEVTETHWLIDLSVISYLARFNTDVIDVIGNLS